MVSNKSFSTYIKHIMTQFDIGFSHEMGWNNIFVQSHPMWNPVREYHHDICRSKVLYQAMRKVEQSGHTYIQ